MAERTRAGLRYGWTTGTCATGAASAAFSALLGRGFPDPVKVQLPRGGCAVLPLAERALEADHARAGIIKDAGDDPDVTHGCLVRATLRRGPLGHGVVFHAGEGVGTITRPGLAFPPGEPAINPVPRQMIREALWTIAADHRGAADTIVELSIPGGEELAKHTLNARLGIMGGLSILGTTGIVTPFSCSAWIHSIHRSIDVARASGLGHLAAATGSTSERAVQALYGLPDEALVEMGDFVGATLKYLRRHPVERLTLAGGFAKIGKLAQGHLDLHSARSALDLDALSGELVELGVPAERAALGEARTAAALLAVAQDTNVPLAQRVARRAGAVAAQILGPGTRIEVIVVDRAGAIVGRDDAG